MISLQVSRLTPSQSSMYNGRVLQLNGNIDHYESSLQRVGKRDLTDDRIFLQDNKRSCYCSEIVCCRKVNEEVVYSGTMTCWAVQ